MTDLLLSVALIGLALIGLHEITRDGMVFGFVERFWKSREWLIRWPISECPTCMTSIWGIPMLLLGHYALAGDVVAGVVRLLIAVLAIAGFVSGGWRS